MSKRRSSKSKQTKDSYAAKQLYAIAAPDDLEIGNTAPGSQIGETLAEEPEQLIGRVLEVPLSDLTGNFSLIYVKLQFQITDVVGKTCKTKFKGHSYAMDYLRSLVKRRRTRVDAIDNIITADGVQMRITTTAFTTHRAKSSIKYAIRKIIANFIRERSRALNFAEMTTQILKGTLNSELYDLCKNIFPLSNVEVQKSKVVTKWVDAS
ncbi:MAG: 30S ribosomal protein S3ae [Candidatus Odinarchaeota archaeon]